MQQSPIPPNCKLTHLVSLSDSTRSDDSIGSVGDLDLPILRPLAMKGRLIERSLRRSFQFWLWTQIHPLASFFILTIFYPPYHLFLAPLSNSKDMLRDTLRFRLTNAVQSDVSSASVFSFLKPSRDREDFEPGHSPSSPLLPLLLLIPLHRPLNF